LKIFNNYINFKNLTQEVSNINMGCCGSDNIEHDGPHHGGLVEGHSNHMRKSKHGTGHGTGHGTKGGNFLQGVK